MALSCIVLDENVNYLNTLNKFLSEIPDIHKIWCFTSITAAENHIRKTNIDLVLIDPNLSKKSKLKLEQSILLEQVVIFISTKATDAVLAYDIGVFDFILKPLNPSRLQLSLKRLTNLDYSQRKEASRGSQAYLEVRCDLMTQRISYEQISYIEAMGDYVKIVTSKRKYVVLMSMKKIEALLPDNLFFRSHKSFIVNLNKIIQFNLKEIHLEKRIIPLSRFRKQGFQSRIQSL